MRLRKRLIIFFMGLVCFSLGIALAVNVQYLGIHPWEVLNVGLFNQLGLSIGTWSIIIGIGLIIITLILDRTYIHIGTFLNVFLVGIAVDFILWLDILPNASNIYLDISVLILSMVMMGIGGGVNNAARIGSGPRDGFMLALSEKLNISIRSVRIVIETIVVLFGILIGGPVFIFTFIYTFVQSPVFQFAFLKTERYLQPEWKKEQQVTIL